MCTNHAGAEDLSQYLRSGYARSFDKICIITIILNAAHDFKIKNKYYYLSVQFERPTVIKLCPLASSSVYGAQVFRPRPSDVVLWTGRYSKLRYVTASVDAYGLRVRAPGRAARLARGRTTAQPATFNGSAASYAMMIL